MSSPNGDGGGRGFRVLQDELVGASERLNLSAADLHSVLRSWEAATRDGARAFAEEGCGQAFAGLQRRLSELLGHRADGLVDIAKAVRESRAQYQQVEDDASTQFGWRTP